MSNSVNLFELFRVAIIL